MQQRPMTRLMKLMSCCLVFLPLFLFGGFSYGQQKKAIASVDEELYVFLDSSKTGELKGYQTKDGRIVIPAKYLIAPDTLGAMAIVLSPTEGFIGINNKGETLLRPFIYDNGPDPLSQGLFRFVENGKMGFADQNGNKRIEARYDFLLPFGENGLARYYIGGEPIYEDGRSRSEIMKQQGEEGLREMHWSWGGAIQDTGLINKKGEKVQ